MKRGRAKTALVAATLAVAWGFTGVAAQAHPDQHGTPDGHLLGTGAEGDLQLLGKADLTDGDDIIADVGVDPRGTHAYLAHWGKPTCATNSEAGGITDPDAGVFVVDIADLENPRRVGFIPHSQDSRPGEGVQALNVSTRFFNGTMLVTNNEQCGPQGKGGVSLYDVSNPLKPRKLSEHFGDRGFADSNDIHSAFAWDAGDKAYTVIVDNLEFPDVDILDITNPKRPRLIAEYDLNDHDVDQPEIGLTSSFIHDMVVKKIEGRWIMLVSYWDGGFVQLDVTNPRSAQFLGDTDYAAIDPELADPSNTQVPAESRSLPPEGNAHQAEFTADNRFFVGTDEDFAPFAVGDFLIATGPNAGVYPSVAVGGAAPATELPDRRLNGPTVYVGYACPDSAPVPPASSAGVSLDPGEELIAVVQRGPVGDPSAPEAPCFPGQKADQAIAAGYDAVVFVNHHAGEAASPDAPFCGSGAFTQPVVGVCTTHNAFHKLFDSVSGSYPEANPALGQVGHEVDVDAIFDGWGYVHLFDAATNQDLDTYAIDEAHDPAFASGFGDLSVHEVATDPNDPSRAYLSYYSGGMRALEIQCTDPSDTSTCELVETGSYLAPEGNDFWGVEAFTRNGKTIVAGSDRDDGLYLFSTDR
ncbi:MAG: hypothetical protein GEV00_08635 [Actinophytocola sp.]|nr:hypothetical protein [Actinophytocola sp.]